MNEYEIKHLEQIRPYLSECMVLLKKDGNFPLSSAGTLALFGNGARHTIKGGTGSGEVNSRFFISVEQGLRDAGFRLTTNFWLDAYDAVYASSKKRFVSGLKKDILRNPLDAATDLMGMIIPEPEYNIPLNFSADAAVYVLSRTSGEGTDRTATLGDIFLTSTERRDILALAEKYSKFMLVINSGGPVDLTGLESVGNILILSQLGVETGAALAEVLLGKACPSGKLTTTWSSYVDYCTEGTFGFYDETLYREGIYVGYRYFDSINMAPLFPFGHGLGYTDFHLSCAGISVEGENISVFADVENSGAFPGKEVVQLYVSCPEGKLDKPYQQLAAFAKTSELLPGEKGRCTLSFSLSELSSYDAGSEAYLLEQGSYILRLGSSSSCTEPVGVLELDKTVHTRKVRNLMGDPGFEDWHPSAEECRSRSVPDLLERIFISSESIPCEECSYTKEYTVPEEVKDFTDEELAWFCVGVHDAKPILRNIAGNSRISVPGAAGQSPNGLVMADGPAGLRLSRKYVVRNGSALPLETAITDSTSDILPDFAVKLANKIGGTTPRPGEEVHEQWATALPIGTAVAQSWNTDFAEICGDVVGAEMEIFGVDLWLAPALNIHRNILCGRNFEYFSEDPMIAGKFAAAITRGVQRHSGCAVTIKHYAANNQEFQRFSSNSRISERALREIYLKGFEIAVKESAPLALMTSYNLINGTHTSESRELINDILRCEWGFDGIVMTDWLIAQYMLTKGDFYAPPQPWQIAAAGGDIVMPGFSSNVRNILRALAEGSLSRTQLEINAGRLIMLANKLKNSFPES